jgi:EAL domain-containing protein (putative c-di-GMP-specific phosphodiesterase class I)
MLLGLRSLGVRIAVDDFGVGHSSLACLSSFPIDGVTIDGSFVSNLGEDRASGSVVAAVVALARALDLDVVAEGVETGRQAAEPRHLGCELAQGFHFANPRELDGLQMRLSTSASGEPPREAAAGVSRGDTHGLASDFRVSGR